MFPVIERRGRLPQESHIESPNVDKTFLDALNERMHGPHAFEAMDELVSRLHSRYVSMPGDTWKQYVADVLMPHSIRAFLHGDLFTYRAFSKPRGYAGDAVMIDMIYAAESNPLSDDSSRNAVARYTTTGTAPRAVGNRRRRLAMMIDEAIQKRSDARILALAAGHMRELDRAVYVNNVFRGEIVALDQDEQSLAVVDHDYAGLGVRALHASIKHLLAGKLDLRGFDLIYAAGLFDYLSQPVAKALCERMFDMLNPGEHMLVANFVPNIPDAGYMESFMDWRLIYRDEVAMRDLAAGLACDRMCNTDLSFDGTRNIAYLSVGKA